MIGRHAEIQTGSGCLAPAPATGAFLFTSVDGLVSSCRSSSLPGDRCAPSHITLTKIRVRQPGVTFAHQLRHGPCLCGSGGLVQAKLARAAGMTASQEQRARRCLAKKD